MKRIVLATLALLTLAAQALAGPLPGAIFTTTVDGSRVNANIYQKKTDVYLDGGPGNNAPSTAAALPEGGYYFQVTDPSGKTLLSQDAVECRWFHVNEAGVIDYVNGGGYINPAPHKTGIDIDHSLAGAITVQLMPYKDTPNKGGVYKVWVTPVSQFVGDTSKVDNPQYFHGFVPSWSKTDCFKVKGQKPPLIKVLKFIDSNMNGVWDKDLGELEYCGWPIVVTDPLSCDVSSAPFTPATIVAGTPGNWTVCEVRQDGWKQTAAYVDNVKYDAQECVTVPVDGTISDEIHTVIFGNTPIICLKGHKFEDLNADGTWQKGTEPGLKDWEIVVKYLPPCSAPGAAWTTAPSAFTDENGCWEVCGIPYGSQYEVSEVLQTDWVQTAPPAPGTFTGTAEGDVCDLDFGNVLYGDGKAYKYYDKNRNGVKDDGEVGIEGWKMQLKDAAGVVLQEVLTDKDGCADFGDKLLPGDYYICEVMPLDTNWHNSSPLCSGLLTLKAGGSISATFTNYYSCKTGFLTKGFWHNKNGVDLITAGDIAYINSLAPYKDKTEYWDSCPFDGTWVKTGNTYFESSDPALAGATGEISDFITAAVNDSPARFQLADQLLAFILNVRHQFPAKGDAGLATGILMPDGTTLTGQEIIDKAIAAWVAGGDSAHYWESILCAFNESSAVEYCAGDPPAPQY